MATDCGLVYLMESPATDKHMFEKAATGATPSDATETLFLLSCVGYNTELTRAQWLRLQELMPATSTMLMEYEMVALQRATTAQPQTNIASKTSEEKLQLVTSCVDTIVAHTEEQQNRDDDALLACARELQAHFGEAGSEVITRSAVDYLYNVGLQL